MQKNYFVSVGIPFYVVYQVFIWKFTLAGRSVIYENDRGQVDFTRLEVRGLPFTVCSKMSRVEGQESGVKGLESRTLIIFYICDKFFQTT